tara:strand:- start:15 stop:728 length:714 start_codon:yes stop_codon:yes gene_type:complete
MIEVCGKPIIQWQVETARQSGIKDIIIVRGYLGDTINIPHVTYVTNPLFAETNMVETLFCAKEYFDNCLMVSYGDILYEKQVLRKMIDSNGDISVAIDIKWRPYWEERFDDPLSDAETLKTDSTGRLIEIGQKPDNLDDIEAQYIGLTVFKGKGLSMLKYIYDQERKAFQNGERFICKERSMQQLYMTDFIQGLINQGCWVSPVPIDGGWLEIDSISDLKIAEKYMDPNSGPLKINR